MTLGMREQPQSHSCLGTFFGRHDLMSGDREKCIRAGCDDFASKPIDAKRLIAIIRHWLPRPEAGSALGLEKESETTVHRGNPKSGHRPNL